MVIHTTIRPYIPTHEGKAAGGVPTRRHTCPGIGGPNGRKRKAEIGALLQTADDSGAEARVPGLACMVRDEKGHQCQTCGQRDRRDRLLSHILLKHLGLKTWVCPLWFVCFL